MEVRELNIPGLSVSSVGPMSQDAGQHLPNESRSKLKALVDVVEECISVSYVFVYRIYRILSLRTRQGMLPPSGRERKRRESHQEQAGGAPQTLD